MVKGNENNKPLVSIVTPSYNQGQFIEDTILSVKNQDYPNIEHIIVDGGSTDNTLEVLKKYEGTYNMRWISEPDEGQADAINKGFEMAKGDILAWLNSDDVYVTNSAISQIASLFQRCLNVEVVTATGVIISEKGHWVQPIKMEEHRICYKHLRYGDSILQPATFFRKKVIENDSLDTSLDYAFDWDFFIRISKKYNILPTRLIIAGYRNYGVNKTASGGAKRAKELTEVTKRYLGKISWQYYVVFAFYILYLLGEKLPGPFKNQFILFIKKLSMILNIITFKRVTSV